MTWDAKKPNKSDMWYSINYLDPCRAYYIVVLYSKQDNDMQ